MYLVLLQITVVAQTRSLRWLRISEYEAKVRGATYILHKLMYCPANSKRDWYAAKIIRASKLDPARFSFFNFKETPSQEEHKPIFSGLTICKMALSDQSDFQAIFRLRKMTYRNFINFWALGDPSGMLHYSVACSENGTGTRRVEENPSSRMVGASPPPGGKQTVDPLDQWDCIVVWEMQWLHRTGFFTWIDKGESWCFLNPLSRLLILYKLSKMEKEITVRGLLRILHSFARWWMEVVDGSTVFIKATRHLPLNLTV